MRRLATTLAMIALAPAAAASAPPAAGAGPAPGAPAALTAAQQRYLALAKAGVARAQQRWRDRRRGWYDARLGPRPLSAGHDLGHPAAVPVDRRDRRRPALAGEQAHRQALRRRSR